MLKVLKVYNAYNGKQIRAQVELLGKRQVVFLSDRKQSVLSIPNFGLIVTGLDIDRQSVTFNVTQGTKEFSKVTLYKE
jgi:hypothetical protein